MSDSGNLPNALLYFHMLSINLQIIDHNNPLLQSTLSSLPQAVIQVASRANLLMFTTPFSLDLFASKLSSCISGKKAARKGASSKGSLTMLWKMHVVKISRHGLPKNLALKINIFLRRKICSPFMYQGMQTRTCFLIAQVNRLLG